MEIFLVRIISPNKNNNKMHISGKLSIGIIECPPFNISSNL